MGEWNNTFPDLPILEELGAQLENLAHLEDLSVSKAHDSSRTGPPQSRARLRLRRALRPALAALAVIALAVPVALLAHSALSPPADQPPLAIQNAVTIARGSGPQDAWQLALTQTPDGSCLRLDISGTQPGPATCLDDAASQARPDTPPRSQAAPRTDTPSQPPPAGSLAPPDFSVTNGPRDGFVFGTVPPLASKVRVSTGDRELTTNARTPAGPLAQKDVKVFVAAFEQRVDPMKTIDVVALDAQGKVLTRVSRPAGG